MRGLFVFFTTIILVVQGGISFAGIPLSNRNYKEFPTVFYIFMDVAEEQTGKQFLKDKYCPIKTYHDKTTNYFYDKGDVYFYETKVINNGFYGSYNADGKLDAFAVEIDTNTTNAMALIINQFRFLMRSLMLIDKDFDKIIPQVQDVVLGRRAYFDYYTIENFYVRIQKGETKANFYTLVVTRPENLTDY